MKNAFTLKNLHQIGIWNFGKFEKISRLFCSEQAFICAADEEILKPDVRLYITKTIIIIIFNYFNKLFQVKQYVVGYCSRLQSNVFATFLKWRSCIKTSCKIFFQFNFSWSFENNNNYYCNTRENNNYWLPSKSQ